MLPEKLLRKSVVQNNRTKLRPKQLPLETFVNDSRNRMLPKSTKKNIR